MMNMSLFTSPFIRRIAIAATAIGILIALFGSSSSSRATVGRYGKDIKDVLIKQGQHYLPFNKQAPAYDNDDSVLEEDTDFTDNKSFDHQETFHLVKDERHRQQCDTIPIDALQSVIDSTSRLSTDQPFVYHFFDGQKVDDSYNDFETTDQFCSVFFVVQRNASRPRPDTEFQNLPVSGMGPDSIHAEIASDDIRLIIPKFHYWGILRTNGSNHILAEGDKDTLLDIAIYQAAYALNHPGDYQVIGETEFQDYDWVMEDPIDLNGHEMPHIMFDRPLQALSPPIHIDGVPASRPKEPCYEGAGPHDLHGRWYRASSFSTTGSMTMSNVASRVMFAEYNTTIDEWGWTFAPDACELTYFEPKDHVNCFAGKTMQFLADSNSRRLLKSLMGGEVGWCTDRSDQACNCVDHAQTWTFDAEFNNISSDHLRDVSLRADPLDFNSPPKAGHVYFDFIGGLIRSQMLNPWSFFFDKGLDGNSIMDHRLRKHGSVDLVHVSTIGWDIGGTKTPNEMLAALPNFKNKTFRFYERENAGVLGDKTRMIHRLANGNCCGNQHPHARYSPPRFVMFNQAWRKFWEEEERKGIVRVVDASVLQGRRDGETKFGCRTTHFPADHVRLEAMMWMNAVCEKVVGGRAKMRDDWGLRVQKGLDK